MNVAYQDYHRFATCGGWMLPDTIPPYSLPAMSLQRPSGQSPESQACSLPCRSKCLVLLCFLVWGTSCSQHIPFGVGLGTYL
eukprot:2218868-Amphidinium_carterae.2